MTTKESSTPLVLVQKESLAAAGWELEWDDNGWVKAIHPNFGTTPPTFPAKHRGLKFIIRRVNKIHAAQGLAAVEVNHEA